MLKKLGVLTGATLGAAGSAFAALPEGAATVFTGVQTDGLAVIALAFPVMGAITAGWIVFSMVRKGANKSAR